MSATDHTVFIAITMDSGEPLRLMGFLAYGRGSDLPQGAVWTHTEGYWARVPTDANVAYEVARSCPKFNSFGDPLPQPVSWRVVSEQAIKAVGTDRTFRDAMADDGRKLHIEMPRAREIHLVHLREARTEHFGKLDREWMKATGQGDAVKAQALENERQTLRDMPTTLPLDTATTPEELKALWPEGLPRL